MKFLRSMLFMGSFLLLSHAVVAQSAAGLAKESQTLLEAGKHDDALAKADAAVAADAKFGEAYFRRGKVKSAKQDDKGAIADFSKAIELGYATGELYRLKGMSEHITQNSAEACSNFAKAISLGDALSEDLKGRFCK